MIYASDVIGMMVRHQDLPYAAALSYQLVEKSIEFLPLVVVRRSRIQNEQFVAAHNVAVGMRRRRKSRRSKREKEDAGSKFNPPHRPAVGLRSGSHSQCCVTNVIRVFGQSSERVKIRRSHDYIAVSPAGHRIARSNPLPALELSCFDYRLLTFRQPGDKEPCIEA